MSEAETLSFAVNAWQFQTEDEMLKIQLKSRRALLFCLVLVFALVANLEDYSPRYCGI